MKRLRFFICAILALTLPLAASAADISDEQLSELSSYNILVGDHHGDLRMGDDLTFGELCKMVTVACGYSNDLTDPSLEVPGVDSLHWAYPYIANAYALSIIDIDILGSFEPGREVTYAETVAVILYALGYEKAAQGMGGYPAGYLYLGATNRTGLLNGVQHAINEPVSRGDAAQLITNALDIDMMLQTGYSAGLLGDTWSVTEGFTLRTILNGENTYPQ